MCSCVAGACRHSDPTAVITVGQAARYGVASSSARLQWPTGTHAGFVLYCGRVYTHGSMVSPQDTTVAPTCILYHSEASVHIGALWFGYVLNGIQAAGDP